MKTAPLGTDEIQRALADLPGWSFRADALERIFEFADFSAALGFIVRVGLHAERLNHHPDLHNVYSRVTLRLNTHDAGAKVTARDLDLARAVQGVATDLRSGK